MAFTESQVYNQIQYHVLEPPDSGATWPSALWTLEEITRYMNQRQDRLLRLTHLQVGLADITVTAGDNLYDLHDDLIRVIRVLWYPASGGSYELTDGDSWEADHGIPDWTTNDNPPKLYYVEPTLNIRIVPLPNEGGTLQVFYVPIGAQFDGTGEVFTVPDEFVPTVKYGVMADMLSKVGRAMDPRAEYCRQRFALGVQVANMLLAGGYDAKGS